MRTILTADIGGTHCRFALFLEEEQRLTLERQIWRPTAGLTNTDEVLEACAEGLAVSLREADTLILAVAGPILNPHQARTTNAALSLDLRAVEKRHGLRDCAIMNDFMAQAHACLTEIGTSARRILPSEEEVPPFAPRGVLGAGTGLGTASLVYDSAGRWLALPSEGGHTSFSFMGEEETAFRDFIVRERKPQAGMRLSTPVECEDVLSGRGLALLHRFLTGEKCSPAEVGETALGHDSPTLRFFARLYGRMCRDWALVTLCRGGLYIAGGIAAKNPLTVTCPAFAEAFLDTCSFGDWLATVPVFLMDCENSGLWGAARHGLERLKSNTPFMRESL